MLLHIVVLEYCAGPSVNQAHVFSSLGNSPQGHKCGLGENNVRVAAMDTWAISSCNLRVPSGPAQARSPVH